MPTSSASDARDGLPVDDIAVGDCLELMAAWPQDSVDLVFADPPYNIGYEYDDHYDDNRDDDEYVQWTCRWIDACARLLKPEGSLYVLIGDEYAAETRLHLKALERDGRLLFRNWIVWHYTFGQNCKVKFNRSHAHLFYCVGSAVFPQRKRERRNASGPPKPKFTARQPPFTFNRPAVAIPSARQTTYGDRRANPTGKLPDDTWYLRPQEVQKELEALADEEQTAYVARLFQPTEDTWYLSRLCGTFKERQGWHPCQLPESLLERIIRVSSNPEDLVFDPFAGSGTTLAVAARLGRRWLGCEMGESYAQRARERARHAAKTGQTMQTTMGEKGIERGRPKKKAEPYRSDPGGRRRTVKKERAADDGAQLF